MKQFRCVVSLIILLILIYSHVSSVNASYIFTDNFENGLNSNWVLLPDHRSPSLVNGSLQFDVSTLSTTFPYIAHTNVEPIKSISFDFMYSTDGADYGSGIVLTENIPTVEMSPPIDRNDYIFAIYISPNGKFNLFSPLCSISGNCTLPVHPNAFYELTPDYNYNIELEFSLNFLNIYVNQTLIKSFPMSNYRANGIYFGNSIKLNSAKIWQNFIIDNVFIDYSNYDSPPVPIYSFLSQIDSRWGSIEYDSASKWANPLEIGIDRWGCALTSAAMTLKNYGIKMPDGNEVNPDRLNTWLRANNGYIGSGLVNWIAITKLAKDSFFANQSTKKLEFVRTYTTEGVTLPAIFGLTGHFVVTHGQESTNWKVNDPAKSVGNTDLPMITTVKSVNRFVPSTTDLSYMLFTKPSGVVVSLQDKDKLPITPTWITEYLTDDLLNSYGPSIDSAMIAKPSSGRYFSLISNSNLNQSEVTVYLYDENGELVKTNLLVEPGNSQYEIVYDKLSMANSRVTLLDTIPPVFVLTNIFTGWYSSPQLAIFNYTDANLRSDYVAPTCLINTEGSNQTCTINPNICDQAGNCNTMTRTSNPANIDLTAPTSEFTLPTSTTNWDGKITGSASDNLSGIAKLELKITLPNNTMSTVIASGTNSWEYVITNIVPGKYRISSVAYDVAGNIQTSPATHEITVVTPTDSKIQPPTNIWADEVADRIFIIWKPVKNASKYRIYYGTKKNDLKMLGETRNLLYLSHEMKPDKYYIGVTAISSTGKESAMSQILKVEIKKQWSLHLSLPRFDDKHRN